MPTPKVLDPARLFFFLLFIEFLKLNFAQALRSVTKIKAPPGATDGAREVICMENRCHGSTDVNWGEGMLFAGILVAWLASVWALCVLGGAQ